jgi:tRNA-dihydrouridine synthase B
MNMDNFWKKIKKPILALAPMAGITDSAFRQISKKYGADVTYSEMASVSALYFKPAKTLRLVKFSKNERPYVVQLFGKDPEHFAKAAKIITEKIKPDGIDINFGCPAKKVFGHGSGCALMADIKLAREIISAVCENTNLPVSIKIRAGLHPVKYAGGGAASPQFNRVKNTSALDFIEKTKDLPYPAVMIHGRTYEGGFSGPVDFSVCEKIKKIAPDKIVLANGGIDTPEDTIKILESHPALDGLGIARGAWGRPWIFQEIKNLLKIYPHTKSNQKLIQLSDQSINEKFKYFHPDYFGVGVKKIMIEHAKLIYKDKKELGMLEIRKHLCWYIKGFPGASELRKKLVLAKSVGEIKEILN